MSTFGHQELNQYFRPISLPFMNITLNPHDMCMVPSAVNHQSAEWVPTRTVTNEINPCVCAHVGRTHAHITADCFCSCFQLPTVEPEWCSTTARLLVQTPASIQQLHRPARIVSVTRILSVHEDRTWLKVTTHGPLSQESNFLQQTLKDVTVRRVCCNLAARASFLKSVAV